MSKFDLLCDLLTSSMMSWIQLYRNIVIILFNLSTGSLTMITLYVLLIIMIKVSFMKEFRGSTLRPSCDIIDDVITTKIFFGMIWDDLFKFGVKMKLCLIFRNFQNGRHFEVATNFFTLSNTGSWIYQPDSHGHFRHIISEILIDPTADILAEIYLKICPTLCPGDIMHN